MDLGISSKEGSEGAAKRILFLVIAVYLVIGFLWGMVGECRLAKKYGRPAVSALGDPYAYLRAVVFAPFWPSDLYWSLIKTR